MAPAELPELPRVPEGCGWRNPVPAYDYDRDTWELYRSHVAACVTLATIKRCGDAFTLLVAGSLEDVEFTGPATEAFQRAARRASVL